MTLSGTYYIIGRFMTLSGSNYSIGRLLHYRLVQPPRLNSGHAPINLHSNGRVDEGIDDDDDTSGTVFRECARLKLTTPDWRGQASD